MNVIALTASDGLFRHWVVKMLMSADKRLGQSTLDFWRATYLHKIKEGRDCFGLFAVENGEPIGCSLASVSPKRFVNRSATIVVPQFRKAKVGTILLAGKLAFLNAYYNPMFFETTVGAANEAGNKLCKRVSLSVIRTGATVREGKDDLPYNVYANLLNDREGMSGSGARAANKTEDK